MGEELVHFASISETLGQDPGYYDVKLMEATNEEEVEGVLQTVHDLYGDLYLNDIYLVLDDAHYAHTLFDCNDDHILYHSPVVSVW